MDQIQNIASAINGYFDLMYDADDSRFADVFHGACLVHGMRDGKLFLDRISRLKRELYDILLRHTGQTLDKIEKDTDRDKFMSAREAQEYGIVDHVLERLPAGQVQPRPPAQ